tara:strand:- start:4822 stop:5730 length:909 start_codon:yes stop_codon:yes gene_type:complete
MIKIKEIETYVPRNNINLLEKYKSISPKFLSSKIGANFLARKGKHETVVDMCKRTLKNLKLKNFKKRIKLIILCTQNPDHGGLPHNSAILQTDLGLDTNIACFDISQGCAGYMYGLKIADNFLKENEIALFFTCDPYSKIIKSKDYKTELLFGDSASLTVIEKNKRKKKMKSLISSDFYTNGKYYDAIINSNGVLKMDGKKVMEFTKEVVPVFIENFLKRNNLKIKDIDRFYFHQGSKHIVSVLNERLNLAKKQCPKFIENLGNTVSSSIPISLKKDNFKKRKKIILCGFGVGLSISIGLLI